MKVRFKNVDPEYGARIYRVIENLPQSDFYVCVMDDNPVPDTCIRQAIPKVQVEPVPEERWEDVTAFVEIGYNGRRPEINGYDFDPLPDGYRMVKVRVAEMDSSGGIRLGTGTWAFRVERREP